MPLETNLEKDTKVVQVGNTAIYIFQDDIFSKNYLLNIVNKAHRSNKVNGFVYEYHRNFY